MESTRDPASGLGPVTSLLGVSQQVRSEVHGLISAVTTFQIKACTTLCSTIEPEHIHSVTNERFLSKTLNDRKWLDRLWAAIERGKKNVLRDARAELRKDNKQVPHQLKFWRVCIPVRNDSHHSRVTGYVVDVDFKARAVRVRSCLSDKFSKNADSHLRSSKRDAFTNAMRSFTEQDRFNGITIADVSLFLDKVVLH